MHTPSCLCKAVSAAVNSLMISLRRIPQIKSLIINSISGPITINFLSHRRKIQAFGLEGVHFVDSQAMAAKILANLIVIGGGMMTRAFVQAYRQALANATKNGVAQETIQNTIRRASKGMTKQEARQILGVTEKTPWEEIVKKYGSLFDNNAKRGSFYLQSKVHRAKECLEVVHQRKS